MLTLDDGPGVMTPDVLRILADANVRALMHVMYRSRAASLAALPRIIAELHADGYRFVTVSDLISR